MSTTPFTNPTLILVRRAAYMALMIFGLPLGFILIKYPVQMVQSIRGLVCPSGNTIDYSEWSSGEEGVNNYEIICIDPSTGQRHDRTTIAMVTVIVVGYMLVFWAIFGMEWLSAKLKTHIRQRLNM